MLLEGTIRNGTIVLDQPPSMLEGSRVEVDIKPAANPTQLSAEEFRALGRVEVDIESAAKPSSSLGEMLLRHAGKAVGLPEDMAAQHDHYLHGTPKR